jgi:CRP-like cAMP-binding protein
VGEVLTPSPGTQLVKEGDSAAVFLVDTGQVEVYRGTAAKPRVVGRVGPGSVLGDIAVFEHTAHKWSAPAVGSVRVVRVERSRFLRELAMHPGLSLRWMAAGLRQLEATQRRVVELMHKPVLARVADLLVDEAHGRNEVNLSQTTIATLLGVSRQSINGALGGLRERGLVDTGYRQIRILDDTGLGDVAGF